MKPPTFLTKYSNLFTKSRILERIVPRQINTPAELQQFNGFVLKNNKEYEMSDLEAINKVSQKYESLIPQILSNKPT